MKEKTFLTLLLGFALLLGCSSDGDNNTPPPDDNPVDGGGSGMVDRSGNLLPTGDSANDLLSNTNFDRLLIEIGFVSGFRPSVQSAINFEEFLRNQTFKENIEIRFLPLDSPNEETLTIQEIADLEEQNRTAYNDGTTLAVYIYFADAPADSDNEEEDLVTVGAVYRNTSMIIYESTIRDLINRSNNSPVTLTDLETATLNHEFGHLFGLVNLGTPAINEHEDASAPNHCNVEGCLMRAEIQFGSVARSMHPFSRTGVLQSACSLDGNSLVKTLEARTARGLAIVPVLDGECILDLRNNGGR
nr:hypothetical protein [Allomuricauda sp.]